MNRVYAACLLFVLVLAGSCAKRHVALSPAPKELLFTPGATGARKMIELNDALTRLNSNTAGLPALKANIATQEKIAVAKFALCRQYRSSERCKKDDADAEADIRTAKRQYEGASRLHAKLTTTVKEMKLSLGLPAANEVPNAAGSTGNF